MSEDKAPALPGSRKLPDNPLEAFRHGALLDLRVRFAMELLTHSPMFAPATHVVPMAGAPTAKVNAALALDTATELFALADQRGLIESLDSEAAVERLKDHIKRQVAFQVAQAKETRRANEEAARVPQAVASALRPGH